MEFWPKGENRPSPYLGLSGERTTGRLISGSRARNCAEQKGMNMPRPRGASGTAPWRPGLEEVMPSCDALRTARTGTAVRTSLLVGAGRGKRATWHDLAGRGPCMDQTQGQSGAAWGTPALAERGQAGAGAPGGSRAPKVRGKRKQKLQGARFRQDGYPEILGWDSQQEEKKNARWSQKMPRGPI